MLGATPRGTLVLDIVRVARALSSETSERRLSPPTGTQYSTER